MKKISKIVISVLISILISAWAVSALFCYNFPMEDKSYNILTYGEDGQDTPPANDWFVFTDSGGNINELTSDGIGGYYGLDYAGQTFYFSRTMDEDLDNPTLRIGVANRTISVFLDDNLIYTDCPEADNRIGYVSLPMLEFDKAEPVIISLPHDYRGRTLTIAQSSPISGETQEPTETVYPCEVTLYCGYSYESGLISDTSKTIIPASLLFTLGILLLIAFIWHTVTGNFIIDLPLLALTVFFEMCGILSSAPFFYNYFGNTFKADMTVLFFHLSVGALLTFLTVRAARFKFIMVIVTSLQLLSVILYLLTVHNLITEYSQLYVDLMFLPQAVGFAGLLTALIYSFFYIAKDDIFHRFMSRTALFLIICYVVFILLCVLFKPDYFNSVISRVSGEIDLLMPKFTLHLLWLLCLVSSTVALVAELLENEVRRRSDASILSLENELAMESYRNLKNQSEETMMLRHDVKKHYAVLKTMLDISPERASVYLDELIGQFEEIYSVIESGNELLDILINGKLSAAKSRGIKLEIIRSEAPETLPLSDAELCSLIVNILDNAINAASAAETADSYIRIDFHCKNNYFVFSCENSTSTDMGADKKLSDPNHGYGLKIISQIIKKYGDMISVERDDTKFKISVALPLDHSSR